MSEPRSARKEHEMQKGRDFFARMRDAMADLPDEPDEAPQ